MAHFKPAVLNAASLLLGFGFALAAGGCSSASAQQIDDPPRAETVQAAPTPVLPDTTPRGAYFYQLGAVIAVGQPGFDITAPEWALGASGVTFDARGRMTANWQNEHGERSCDAILRGETLSLDCSGTHYTAIWREKGTIITDVLTRLLGAPTDPATAPLGQHPLHVLAELDKPFETYGEPLQDAGGSPSLSAAMNARVLGLSGATKQHITAFRAAVATRGVSAASGCAHVRQAHAIDDELAAIRGASPENEVALGEATDALSAALLGVSLGFGPEGFRHGVHWKELAADLGEQTPSGQLLGAIHGVVGTEGYTELIDWTWWAGGPTNLGRAAARLGTLAGALKGAPPCLVALVSGRLQSEIEALGQRTCYSVDEAAAQAQLEALTPVLDSLSSLGGPETRERITAAFTEGRAVFDDPQCGG